MRSLVWRPWALILAGGDGLRLRALTRQIAGDLRPKQYCPILDGETLPVRHALSAHEEACLVDDVYMRMAPVNFSEWVLRPGTRHLATLLPVKDLAWSDWGDPARVLATLHGAGARPSWLTRVELEVAV
jgi:hypothetical protein